MRASRAWFGAVITVLYALLAVAAIATSVSGAERPHRAADQYQPKSKAELRRQLTRLQYEVTQEAGTEPAFKNRYWNNKQPGIYHCIVCDLPLFSSQTKFKSGTGWPSFWQPIDQKLIGTSRDWKLFYPRTEVHCSRCKAHLGHVFADGPRPTGLRYCLNSAALRFEAAEEGEKKQAARE